MHVILAFIANSMYLIRRTAYRMSQISMRLRQIFGIIGTREGKALLAIQYGHCGRLPER